MIYLLPSDLLFCGVIENLEVDAWGSEEYCKFASLEGKKVGVITTDSEIHPVEVFEAAGTNKKTRP